MSDAVVEDRPDDTTAMRVFALPQSRTALLDAPGALRIGQLIETIEQVPKSNPELVFDLCRALIESVCKTILNDLGEAIPPKPNAENMTAAIIRRLSLFLDPKSAEAEAKRAVGDTVGGINKLVNGIGEYRRKLGTASHGRDGYDGAVDLSHAMLTVGVTDSLVAFLFSSHQRLHGQEEWHRATLGDHEDFDQYLDDEHDPSPIPVFGDFFRPSAVLFGVNRTGYLKRLNDWRKLVASGEAEGEEDE